MIFVFKTSETSAKYSVSDWDAVVLNSDGSENEQLNRHFINLRNRIIREFRHFPASFNIEGWIERNGYIKISSEEEEIDRQKKAGTVIW